MSSGASQPEEALMREIAERDRVLRVAADAAREERRKAGVEGMTGGLQHVVINVQPERHKDACEDILRRTGYALAECFADDAAGDPKDVCVLKLQGSADILVTSRRAADNPFRAGNVRPKSAHLPDTRLETFTFACADLERFVALQKARGLDYLTPDLIETEHYKFIQTRPSAWTGNSIGLIQWKTAPGTYAYSGCRPLDWAPVKPDLPHLADIGRLDHTATRVEAANRDAAILEFMRYTDYDFAFAVYVESLNSITNVARLSPTDFAMVFTSGISPYVSDAESGPTEKYISNYGTRVHHMAFDTANIERVQDALEADGMGFLVGLVGSPEEGLKQSFSKSSPHTLIVNEYIHRYSGFDGFFTKSNVTLLTKATEQQ